MDLVKLNIFRRNVFAGISQNMRFFLVQKLALLLKFFDDLR